MLFASWSRTICMLAASLFLSLALPARAQIRLDLPSQPLGTSLTAIGTLGHLNIMFDPSVVDGLQAPALNAELSADDALDRLLAGTKLQAVHVDANTIRVIAGPGPKRAQSTAVPTTGAIYAPTAVHLASAGPDPDAQGDQLRDKVPDIGPHGATPVEDKKKQGASPLEEVVVTGTHISGVTDTASPISTYTRDDIDRSGAGTVADFVRLLPDNFNGGASDITVGAVSGGGNADNRVGGSGVNLRGLGSDATLVLIDGRRVAPGNVDGNFVDISMIPLAAVERIDVVPDGASAIYGSDAVGGVVNFIMRRDFDGAETRARYADANGFHETEAAQTFGKTWTSGSAVLSYEYDDRTPLFARDRIYTLDLLEPTTLLPSQRRNSVFADFTQVANANLNFFGEGYYSRRDSESDIADIYNLDDASSSVSSYSGTVGARGSVTDKLNLEVSGSYAGGNNRQIAFDPPYSGANERSRSTVWSADAKADGTMGSTWAGPVRFAVGAEYRKEALGDVNVIANTTFTPRRDVTAEYLEIQLPLIGSSTPQSPNVLEVSLAGRAEHYSDFGSTNNPKVGLIWRPAQGLKLHGSYGTSFKAPILYDLNPTPSAVIAASNYDPLTGQNAKVLIPEGGNPNLKPEKARSWTFGVEFEPEGVPNLRVGATYYNIVFKDLITTIIGSSINIFSALQSESTLGPEIVERNPPLALVRQLLASANLFDESGPGFGPAPGGLTASEIAAIVDGGYLNLSTERTSGVDVHLAYTAALSFGSLETGVDTTRIITFDTQFEPGSPTVSVLNTPYNPADLRLRGHCSLVWQDLTATGFLNYVNSYYDPRFPPTVRVGSWTTGDVILRYDFNRRQNLLHGTALQLAINNITNAPPPYVHPLYSVYPVTYDGANANPVGRLVSLQVTKRW